MRKPHFMGSLDICKAMASKRIGHGDLLNKYTLPLISSRIKMLVDTATLPIPISHNSTSLLFLLLHGKPLLSLVEREQGTRRNWLACLWPMLNGYCRDSSLWETRGTHLTVTRGTHHHPNHHHPDSPKDMHKAVLLSGSPQGKAKDVSTSPIQGRANVAGKAQTSGQPS